MTSINFDLTVVGFGVIGIETVSNIIKFSKKKKIKIIILEKNISNITGGVAYSKKTSKYGFFNNPLRLSHPEFIKWIKNKKNKIKIVKYIKNTKEDWLNSWLIKNQKILLSNSKGIDEIYLPRLVYSMFLDEKLKKVLKICKTKNVKIHFFNGELSKITKKKHLICECKKNFKQFKINNKNNLIKITTKSKIIRNFITRNIVIGTGLLPPKKIRENRLFKNQNYIWDFYSEGGTYNLLAKIKKNLKIKRKIKIVFIGNKAGLLETMPELEKIIVRDQKKIELLSISPKLISLEKAEHSENYLKYKFKYLTRSNINKIKKSNEIVKLLQKEFKHSVKNKFNKYDVWTKVLKEDLIKLCFSKLSKAEKEVYNNRTFTKIRNLTRYTYPNTIISKNRLVKLKKLSFLKDKVISLKFLKSLIKVVTKSKKIISADMVVNVSGPAKLDKFGNEDSLVNSIKRLCFKFNERGFFANENFEIGNRIYAPGLLSSNFNPNRHTIIKAITINSHKSATGILKSL